MTRKTFLYRGPSGDFYTVTAPPSAAPPGAIREVPEGFRVRPGMDVDADGVPFVADLGPSREEARARVNALTAEVRERYITPAPGQDMIYLRKADEARRFIEAGEPDDLTDFPFLAAETGITAPTAHELAQIWLNLAAHWEATAAALEHDRFAALSRIEAATSVAEIDAAVAGFETEWRGKNG